MKVGINVEPAPISLQRNLLGTLLFWIYCALVSFSDTMVDDYTPKDPEILNYLHAVYDRDLAYKSDYLPLSNLLPFTLIMIGGYFFITVCVIGRRTPFLTENGNSYDFVCFLFMIPFVFFTSTVVNWRSRHSKMCHVIGQLPYTCEYSQTEIFIFNNGFWTTSFCFGLQVTILKENLKDWLNFSLTAASLANLSWKNIVGLASVGVALLVAIGLCVFSFVEERLWFILFVTIAWILFFLAGSVFNAQGRTFHLHHWTLGFVFTTYLSYPNWLFSILHGIACGVMIDGGARWGWDDVWKTTDALAPGKWGVFQKRDDYQSQIDISSAINYTNFVNPKAWDSKANP